MATDQALVLAAHGSHHDPRTAEAVHRHADRVRERGHFDAVRPAFWKEAPSLAEVRSTIEASTTYVVPLLTSEGYFADVVFPRELGIDGSGAAEPSGTVRYTAPVGTHERLVDVVLDRVSAATAGTVPAEELGIALVGHGTDRHADSAGATQRQARRIRSLDRFAAVEALFLDQAPAVADLETVFDVRAVAVVPFFVADGHHVRRDVPAAIGLQSDGDPFGGPIETGGLQLWYARPVGTASGLTDVVLERAAEAGADLQAGASGGTLATAERAFLEWIEAGRRAPHAERGDANAPPGTSDWGELALTVTGANGGERRYDVRHRADVDTPAEELAAVASPAAVRERTRTTETGTFRPHRFARTLPRGWRFQTSSSIALVRAVRAIYPASIDHWYRGRTDSVAATRFEAVVARQAGRYRDLDALDERTVTAAIEACCGDCVRRPAWSAGSDEPPVADGSFPCPEPCSFLLEAIRAFGDPTTGQPADTAAPSVPPARFDDPANRYRTRYERARRAPERPIPDP